MDFSARVNFQPGCHHIGFDDSGHDVVSGQGGMLYKKMNASPVEKVAIDSLTVDSDSSKLQLHFKTDDKQFQSLMHSICLPAVSK